MSTFAEIAKSVHLTGATHPPRLARVLMYTADRLKTGSPSIYKLRMREESRHQDKGSISRQSIGNPGERCLLGGNEKVVLLVGATGAGKSTLINGMMNYILDIQWEDDFRFKLITEDDKSYGITAYTVYPMSGSKLTYAFTVIDCPSFGPAEGTDRNKEIAQEIMEFLFHSPAQGINHIDGIGFVVQSSQVHLSHAQQCVFDTILSMFGKDISEKIFAVVTFADGRRPSVLDAIKKAEMPLPIEKHYKFNNSALFAQNNTEVAGRFGFDGIFWQLGLSAFSAFFEDLRKSKGISLRLTREALQAREKLHEFLVSLHSEISLAFNKIEEIRQEAKLMVRYETEIEANKDFTYEIGILKDKYIDVEEGRSNRTWLDNCKCGSDCERVRFCALDGRCPNQCMWPSCKSCPRIAKRELVKEKRTWNELRQRCGVHDKEPSQMTKYFERKVQEVHLGVLEMMVKIQRNIFHLNKIALKPHSLEEVEYIQLLIEWEKSESHSRWRHRVSYFEEIVEHAKILSNLDSEEKREEAIHQLSRKLSLNPQHKFCKMVPAQIQVLVL